MSEGYEDNLDVSGDHSIAVGEDCTITTHHAICIGKGLTATEPLQCVMGVGGDQAISTIMTEAEYKTLRGVILRASVGE